MLTNHVSDTVIVQIIFFQAGIVKSFPRYSAMNLTDICSLKIQISSVMKSHSNLHPDSSMPNIVPLIHSTFYFCRNIVTAIILNITLNMLAAQISSNFDRKHDLTVRHNALFMNIRN